LSQIAFPDVGVNIPERIFTKVVFPAPFSPIKPINSPGLIVKLMFVNALTISFLGLK